MKTSISFAKIEKFTIAERAASSISEQSADFTIVEDKNILLVCKKYSIFIVVQEITPIFVHRKQRSVNYEA